MPPMVTFIYLVWDCLGRAEFPNNTYREHNSAGYLSLFASCTNFTFFYIFTFQKVPRVDASVFVINAALCWKVKPQNHALARFVQ